jgi:hypothetical protein
MSTSAPASPGVSQLSTATPKYTATFASTRLRTTPANGGKLIEIVLERAIGLASSSFHHIPRNSPARSSAHALF